MDRKIKTYSVELLAHTEQGTRNMSGVIFQTFWDHERIEGSLDSIASSCAAQETVASGKKIKFEGIAASLKE